MESDKFFLKTESEMTDKMISNLRNLLFSNEDTSIQLALQLLQSGGVSNNLISLVLGFSKWHQDSKVRFTFWVLFEKFASENLQNFIQENWEDANIEYVDDEITLSKGFDLMATHPEINVVDLANIHLTLSSLGGKYCLENKTDTNYNILNKIIIGNQLNLSNYWLDFLPEEIGDFPHLKVLYLNENHFKTLPESAKNLKKVIQVDYYDTPLSRDYLSNFFPEVFYVEYYNEGCDLKTHAQYLEAEKLFRRAAELKPDYAEAWHNIGASLIFADKIEEAKEPLYEAIKKYEIRLQDNPKNAWNWFWKSCVYALLRNKEQSLEDLKTCIKIAPHYKEKAAKEEDYRDFFDDEDFQTLIQ